MPFEHGSISLRLLYLPRDLPADAVEAFARHAAPPLETLGAGEIHGWVTGRHLLDRKITRETARFAGFLRLSLMQAERRIPPALFRAECRIQELARMQASGTDRLPPKARLEIRQEVADRLLPQMPPTLRGIHMLHRPGSRILYTTAISERQLEAFQIGFSRAIGFAGIPLSADTASLQRRRKSIRDWPPVSFSPRVNPEAVAQDPGLDFLTWLWFFSEARGGIADFGDRGRWAVSVEGPFTFVMEGAGAHETVVRRGEPRFSAEAKAALLSGKKLRRAKVTLARGEQVWSFSIDAATFVFRGLRLPEGERLDAASRFEERMDRLDEGVEAFLSFFDRFADERESSDWTETLGEIRHWMETRTTRD
ncbi:MAG: hypothetical protein NZ740_02900 [Kiritimatiellae bacterium]|nr:hypothetical protein [Kiritimatiellia bacterium]MDW8458041.1 hypothetical protein [Verrucomicrobiota bacterium]